MYLMLKHGTIKRRLKDPISYLFKMTLTYQPGFLHYFFIFKQLFKTFLFTAVYTLGKEKTGTLCSGRL